MDVGKKIQILKESAGFKNYQEFGKSLGLPGDWINDLSKKTTVSTIDINRLKIITDYFQITLDWLFEDIKEQENTIECNNLLDTDIGKMLIIIQNKLSEKDNEFLGYKLSNKTTILLKDAIDEVIGLVKDNL